MGKKLVIVESPAKAKTIGRYLGKDYVTEFRTFIAEPLQREVSELRQEVDQLRHAIQRIDRCPHRAQCPVLDGL